MNDLDSKLSEIKEVDYNSSYSKNSSNISQKTTKKEKYKNNFNKFKAFDYENVATNKMRYINFNFINNSIIRLKDILQENNPLWKFIQYAKPYNITNNKLESNDINNNNENIELLLNKDNNFVTKKFPKKITKEVFNFNNKIAKKNFYFTRMNNIESKKLNLNLIDKVILIQKNIRGFLSKKVIYSSINNEIAKNIITSVLIIQKAFRKFISKKHILDNYIMKIINKERNDKGNKIIRLFKSYHYRNLFLKKLLIKKIVITRYLSAQLIQSTFKSYILRRKVLAILKKEKKSYVLIYPFEAKSVKIKIFINGIKNNNIYKMYEYFMCPVRKYFVSYINKKDIKPGEYLCQMIVNNSITSDKRYKFVNNLYNLIPIGNYKSKKPKKFHKGNNNDSKDIDQKIKYELDTFYSYFFDGGEEKEFDKDYDFSHSKNSESSKKEAEINKIFYLNEIDEENPDQVIDISKSRYNFNNIYLKSNYNYIKDYNNKKKEKELYENRIKNIFDNLYSFKDEKDNDSIHNSENLNYKDILEEVSQRSVKSYNTNVDMKNINSYSKTHKTKFKKNESSKNKNVKKSKKKKYNIKF